MKDDQYDCVVPEDRGAGADIHTTIHSSRLFGSLGYTMIRVHESRTLRLRMLFYFVGNLDDGKALERLGT